MKTNQTTPKTIDEYLARFPQEVQTLLQKIRMTIHQAAPGAEEKISYQIEEFKEQLSAYAGGKGTVQFPFDQPIPFGLIKRIVKFRIKKNRERAEARAKKKSSAKAKPRSHVK